MNGFMLTPNQLGAPQKFREWRPQQLQTVTDIITGPKFPTSNMPTGSGKSLVPIMVNKLSGLRVVVLTATKGLQDQYVNDFAEAGIFDIRGRGNYECSYQAANGNSGVSYDDGPCHTGFKCPVTGLVPIKAPYSHADICPYLARYRQAQTAPILLTNYPYWFSITTYGKGLGGVDVLVCDEAHEIVDELSKFLSVELSDYDIHRIRCKWPTGMREGLIQLDDPSEAAWWSAWVTSCLRAAPRRLASPLSGSEGAGEKRRAEQIIRSLDRLAKASVGLVAEQTQSGWRFEPIWPGGYADDYLFSYAAKVALMSATISPRTLQYLAVPQDQLLYREYASDFPAEDRRVTFIPTIYNTHRATDEMLETWLDRIDEIIEGRQDRKGIIHTVSYSRAELIVDNSRYKHLMMTHDSRNTKQVISDFKAKDGPAILVSPAVSTGYDFPGRLCEYQIISKIPVPDTRGAVMRARTSVDRHYPYYIAANTLMQMVGRAVRYKGDRCETFVVDNTCRTLFKDYGDFFPWYFRSPEAYIVRDTVPPAPERLER